MRKISGQVVSTKVTTLSQAAEIVSHFAAIDNGSSSAVFLYLQRTADAFYHLVQFHNKRSKLKKSWETSPNLQADVVVEKTQDGDEGKNLENKVRKKDKKRSDNTVETNLEADVEVSVKKKKKKKRKSDDDNEMKEKSSKKKKRKSDDDSEMKEKSSKKKKKKKNRDEAVADL